MVLIMNLLLWSTSKMHKEDSAYSAFWTNLPNNAFINLDIQVTFCKIHQSWWISISAPSLMWLTTYNREESKYLIALWKLMNFPILSRNLHFTSEYARHLITFNFLVRFLYRLHIFQDFPSRKIKAAANEAAYSGIWNLVLFQQWLFSLFLSRKNSFSMGKLKQN